MKTATVKPLNDDGCLLQLQVSPKAVHILSNNVHNVSPSHATDHKHLTLLQRLQNVVSLLPGWQFLPLLQHGAVMPGQLQRGTEGRGRLYGDISFKVHMCSQVEQGQQVSQMRSKAYFNVFMIP